MTKLIIQIPCYNEAESLPQTLRDLPRQIPGISNIEWLIIDDGSVDETSKVALEHGANHIVRHARNLGLARAFATGLDACIKLGADIIVNTDADNQYNALDLPKLIAPILEGKADIVIGERPIDSVSHFSLIKKALQRFGSLIVRLASNTSVPDAPSGFRAISRRAAMQVHVFSTHTYTLETIIQAGHKGLTIISVPIRTNEYLRPSRLISSTFNYIVKSILTIVRIFMIYQPLIFFAAPGVVFFFLGMLFGMRFLFFYLWGEGQGHIQSLILTAILLGASGLFIVLGLLAELVSVNRKLLERIDLKIYEMMENMNKND
jgi:glycosyltransferase involved in cell wall biosynthesis